MEPLIGMIILFAGNFAPRGWALCDGQLLPIAQNDALFSVLGTTYGGDGRTTFALPDLRGRAPIHAGQGPGLTRRALGARGGLEAVALTSKNVPTHEHALKASTDEAAEESAEAQYLGASQIYTQGGNLVALGAGSITTNPGGNEPVPTMPPFLAMNYIIALQGLYPSRS